MLKKKSINTQCRIKCNFLSIENRITENSGGDFCKHMFSRLTTKLGCECIKHRTHRTDFLVYTISLARN